MKPKISLIAAISRNRAIGKNNGLLWRIPEELKRFRKITTGHPIIMGRKTYESIGRPLPERTNIIITRDKNFIAEGSIVCYSLDEALGVAKEKDREEIFIIGGGEIYKQALPLADKLYLTIVKGEFPEADTFFPDYSGFKQSVSEEAGESAGYQYTFLELER